MARSVSCLLTSNAATLALEEVVKVLFIDSANDEKISQKLFVPLLAELMWSISNFIFMP